MRKEKGYNSKLMNKKNGMSVVFVEKLVAMKRTMRRDEKTLTLLSLYILLLIVKVVIVALTNDFITKKSARDMKKLHR